jgi:hypothetical protein
LVNFVGSVVGFLSVFVRNGRDRSLPASSLPPRYPLKAKLRHNKWPEGKKVVPQAFLFLKINCILHPQKVISLTLILDISEVADFFISITQRDF